MLDHVDFAVTDLARSRAFYENARAPLGTSPVAADGIDNGAPCLRPRYHPNYYAAFVLDPDGHNIEAVCHRKE